jgi:hypothetical protein
MSILHMDVLILFFFSTNQCCSFSSFHPPSPINLGEEWTKLIYEAVRGSPQWSNTLFLITFDEHGVCNTLSYHDTGSFILHRVLLTTFLLPLASPTLTA